MRHYPANLDRPSWQWSKRDWRIFKTFCHQTPHQAKRHRRIMEEYWSGKSVKEIAKQGEVSVQYIYMVLALEELRWKRRTEAFYAGRRNLGRPIDMDGTRDEWIDWDLEETT